MVPLAGISFCLFETSKTHIKTLRNYNSVRVHSSLLCICVGVLWVAYAVSSPGDRHFRCREFFGGCAFRLCRAVRHLPHSSHSQKGADGGDQGKEKKERKKRMRERAHQLCSFPPLLGRHDVDCEQHLQKGRTQRLLQRIHSHMGEGPFI